MTQVQLNFKFGLGVAGERGVESIDLGHELEKKWERGEFQPLPDFPLIRIEIEEIYCTAAPTDAPTIGATGSPSYVPYLELACYVSKRGAQPCEVVPYARPCERTIAWSVL